MMKCGLLGRKLAHSYSPTIHSHLGNYRYDLYEKEPEALSEFLKCGEFHGLNVTIPYKKTVIPYCKHLSPVAERLGAVNTIVRNEDGSLVGHNTDYFGFQSMLEYSNLSVKGKKALVLGSGGASATVCSVLSAMDCEPVVISRSGNQNYQNLSNHPDASIVINTTPVGMYPATNTSPIDLDLFPSLEGVLDLIYNPARTRLLQQASGRGLIAINGLRMLVAQAIESAEWFTGQPVASDSIQRIHSLLQTQMENIILIGMPGSGKSTIGNLLARRMGKAFVDADTKIEEITNMTIPQIFTEYGEEYFRRLESDILADLGKQSSLVIATGGGCVTRPENYPLLSQNGRIIWIQRDIDHLSTEGRPLSHNQDLNKMYLNRMPMYAMFADTIIDNNGSPEETVSELICRR